MVVLQTDNTLLYERLEKRGYPEVSYLTVFFA